MAVSRCGGLVAGQRVIDPLRVVRKEDAPNLSSDVCRIGGMIVARFALGEDFEKCCGELGHDFVGRAVSALQDMRWRVSFC